MKSPERFLILLIAGILLSSWIIQYTFKNFPKLYHGISIHFLKQQITNMNIPESNQKEIIEKQTAWFEKNTKLIQKQIEDQNQIELHMQGPFSDLAQSLKDLPVMLLISADIHKENNQLVMDLVIKK